MALVLAMREGRSFYVGDIRVEVTRVGGPRATVRVHGDLLSIYHLNHATSVEVLPGVKLTLGLGSTPGTAKIAVEAGRQHKILRDNLYLEEKRRCG